MGCADELEASRHSLRALFRDERRGLSPEHADWQIFYRHHSWNDLEHREEHGALFNAPRRRASRPIRATERHRTHRHESGECDP